MLKRLDEDSRNQLLQRGKSGEHYKDTSKGKNRYERRTKSRISNSVKEYNKIDMNKFFSDDILDFSIKVDGETNDYLVSISFSNLLETIRKEIKSSGQPCSFSTILKSTIKCFNQERNVYVKCSCPDWNYRFSYYAALNNITFGEKENRPSKETNPDDKLGPACKHVLLVLSNTSWINKISSTIWNYICYIQKHYEQAYADKIYPKLYGKKYDQDVQLGLFDDEADKTDSQTIDKSNEEGRNRGKFKPGNQSGFQFTKKMKPMDGQMELDLDQEED